MPLSDSFRQQLRGIYTQLGEAQRSLAALKDEAEFDGLPPEIVSTLARKGAVLGYTRQDLKQIPDRVKEAEAQR